MTLHFRIVRQEKICVKNCTRTAPKSMPPILLCWFMTSEVDVGDMAVFPCNLAVPQIAAERQFHKLSSDIDVCMRQRCAVQFLQWEKVTLAYRH